MPFGAVEHDNLVVPRTTRHARGIFFARAFDQDLEPLTDTVAVLPRSNFVNHAQEARVALFFDFLRNLIRHGRSGRVAADGVFEDESVIKIDFARERKSLLEIGLALAGKADDEIGGHAHLRLNLAQLVDDPEKSFARVAAVHEFKHAVAPALHRDVRALDELRQARVGFNQIVSVTFRVRRSEADALQSLDLVDGFEQLHEGRLAIFRADLAPPITRHDLAQQRDLLHAARRQLLALGDDFLDGPASLFPACVRHDAKGAILIATLHDADERGDGLAPVAIEQVFANRRLAARLGLDVQHFLAATGEDAVEVIARAVKFLSAEDEVHVRKAVQQFLAAALGHAAHEAEDDIGAAAAQFGGEGLHFAEGLLLGGITHAAGVQEHDIGGGFRGGEAVAFADELSGDLFGVALIHLTTVSFDIDTRHLLSAPAS